MSADVQHTLASSATLEGTSLHTGAKVTLTLKPAPADHGFKFRRIDLPDQPFIDADADKVQTVERATTLASPDWTVITNDISRIEITEPDAPDGGARFYRVKATLETPE